MADAANKIKKMELDVTQVTRTQSIFNQNQIQKIFNSTPARYVHVRPAKGGGTWKYPKIGYIRQNLDSIFGFNWDFITPDDTLERVIELIKLGVPQVIVKGTLVGRTKVDGEWVTIKKSGTGRADIKFKKELVDGKRMPMDLGNDVKAAETDCLKKCASKLGIAADIYEADEFMEILITNSDEDKAKGAQRQADKLKKKLDKKVIASGSESVGGQNEGKTAPKS